MVRYYDDESVFEGSIEKVWKLVQSHTDANVSHIHTGFVDQHTKDESAGAFLATVGVRTPGGLIPTKIRFVIRAPHSQTVQFLEGVFAGSWFTTTYVPDGPHRTRAVVAGEFRIPGLDDASILKAVDAFMETGFNEDSAYLKKMA